MWSGEFKQAMRAFNSKTKTLTPCKRIEIMETFSYALKCLKRGRRVARHGWNGRGMWIEMQTPGAESKMNLPYLYIEYPEGHDAYPHGCRVPWLASQTDLLAEDWFVLEEGY